MKFDRREKEEHFKKMLNAHCLTDFEMDQMFLGEEFLEEHVFMDDDDFE